MYSRYNFGPAIASGFTQPPVLSGPDRPGLHKSTNPFDESDIYMATKNPDGTWSEPVNLGFNGAYGDSSGMEINGGNTFIWLRGNGTTNDIVMSNKNTDGTWTTPIDLGAGINDHASGVIQDNPHLSADGAGLWFTSNRSGGSGDKDIWFSIKDMTGNWSAPVNVGSTFNTLEEEDQFFFSLSNDIFWNSSLGIKHCVSNGATCSAAPEVIAIPGCTFAAEVSMTDDGQYIYFGCADATTFMVQIMYSQKQSNGSWGQATPVD